MKLESASFDGAPSQYDLPVRDENDPVLKCLYDNHITWGPFRKSQMLAHAMQWHWWPPSEKFLNPKDMAAVKEQRRRYRSVMGEFNDEERGPDVAQQMNREGL